jgi:hypothetical protein
VAGNLPPGAPPPPLPGQRAKTPLAERRAAKDRQRKQRATQTLAAAVAEATEVPPLLTILGLASVFGTQQTNSTGWQIYDPWLLETWPDGLEVSPLALWKLAEDRAAAPATAEDLGAHLWRRVLPVLLKRTDTMGTPDDVLRAWDEASRLGTMVGIDCSQHLAQATADLPDPQSWTAEAAAMARAAAQAAAASEADLTEDEVDEEAA